MQTLHMIEGIHYKTLKDAGKFKYELLINLSFDASKWPAVKVIRAIHHRYYSIMEGVITAKEGYRWDGASGPTLDDETNLRASLFHDIGYQSMSEQPAISKLSWWRKYRIRVTWDKMFRSILKADGMPFVRRFFWYWSVRGVGALFAYT